MKNIYGAYTHARPNGVVFYVGKGTRERSRIPRRQNKYWKAIVNKYKWENIIVRFYPCASEKKALQKEIQMIANYRKRGVKLVNTTDGGEGISGYRFSLEQRKGMIITRSQPSYRENLKEKLKKAFSRKEYRKLRSELMEKRWKDENLRKVIIDKLKVTLSSPENKKKRSLLAAKQWKNPEFRKALKITYNSKRRSIAMKKAWNKRKKKQEA